MSKKHHKPPVKLGGSAKDALQACYTPEQAAYLARLEDDLTVQLAVKPRRLEHSLGVARTAERLALIYGVDPFLARAAGLLHDWCKAESNDELLVRARETGLDAGPGVDLADARPLLHGLLAAVELPERYPELPDEVWRAIAVHTTAGEDMGTLDMVLYVADGIEPGRPSTPDVEHTRSLVGKASLFDLFWSAFVGSIVYVLQTGRYLYPPTIDVYNAYVRAGAEGAAPEPAAPVR